MGRLRSWPWNSLRISLESDAPYGRDVADRLRELFAGWPSDVQLNPPERWINSADFVLIEHEGELHGSARYYDMGERRWKLPVDLAEVADWIVDRMNRWE